MSTQKRLFTAMTPSFCSLTDTKQSLQYTIKTHLSGPPMPKFEANMNYIPPSPPSSMKQCNKSATVKFHMELLLITTTRKQSRSGATPYSSTVTGGRICIRLKHNRKYTALHTPVRIYSEQILAKLFFTYNSLKTFVEDIFIRGTLNISN